MNDMISADPIGTDIAVIQRLTPAVVFSPGRIDQILAAIETEVRRLNADISTAGGRDAVRSMAYKVARSKTALDAMGKTLTEEWRTQTAAVNADRKAIRDRLDALADEVRRPLTDWEQAEKDRVARHEAAIAAIEATASIPADASPKDVEDRISALNAEAPRDWQEFTHRAAKATATALDTLKTALAAAVQRAAEAEELARLRAEAEEQRKREAARLQAEREARIATEAAERAKKEAEIAAERERRAAVEAAERREREARLAAERAEAQARKAEADRIAAQERAEREKREAAATAERERVAAIEAERKRAADAKAAEEAEAARRAANIAHRKQVNNEVLAALTGIGAGADLAKGIIAAIARGDVPHVVIRY